MLHSAVLALHRAFQICEAGAYLHSQSTGLIAEAASIRASGGSRVVENLYVCSRGSPGVKASRLDSFSILTLFLSNCYVAEDHFFPMMPHDHPQHFVCKNTHDLLDIGLTRSGPLLGSPFDNQISSH